LSCQFTGVTIPFHQSLKELRYRLALTRRERDAKPFSPRDKGWDEGLERYIEACCGNE
jgi:hypothetical protein